MFVCYSLSPAHRGKVEGLTGCIKSVLLKFHIIFSSSRSLGLLCSDFLFTILPNRMKSHVSDEKVSSVKLFLV